MDQTNKSVNDLARACAYSADAAEWQELVRRSMPLVSVVALRVSRMWATSPSPAAVDDIVQEVFLKLCEQERRVLRTFEPRGEDSFFGLLRIVTGSVANDYFRRLYSVKRGGKVMSMPLLEDQAQETAFGTAPAERMQQSALLAQLDSQLRSAPDAISERDRASILALLPARLYGGRDCAGFAGRLDGQGRRERPAPCYLMAAHRSSPRKSLGPGGMRVVLRHHSQPESACTTTSWRLNRF